MKPVRRSALPTTKSEEQLIAAAAIFALLYALPGGALHLTDLLS